MARTMLRHRRGPWDLIMAVTLLIASAGCGSAGVVGAPPALTAEPATLSAPLPTPERTDVAGAAPIPIATGASAAIPPAPAPTSGLPALSTSPLTRATQTPIVIQAESPRVEPGRAYDFNLYTHCGVNFDVDFDGSLWTWLGSGRPDRSVGDPSQRGTMTLTGPDEARFDYPGGSLRFKRHQGPLTIPGPCL
jgi:hypothetical protein